MKCTSCYDNLLSEDNFTKFLCPQCNKSAIVRCLKCRRKSTNYICKECGFEGP